VRLLGYKHVREIPRFAFWSSSSSCSMNTFERLGVNLGCIRGQFWKSINQMRGPRALG
jgi:hypothetical protein